MGRLQGLLALGEQTRIVQRHSHLVCHRLKHRDCSFVKGIGIHTLDIKCSNHSATDTFPDFLIEIAVSLKAAEAWP